MDSGQWTVDRGQKELLYSEADGMTIIITIIMAIIITTITTYY